MDVSILICTYNSTKRLPETLCHLSYQKVPGNIQWEILVVDYASKDGTPELALQLWDNDAVPLRIFHEKKAGKSHALETGFRNAKGKVVCIVDDDNWVCEDYVRIAYETMAAHSDVGIIGARGEAACEILPPPWFEEHKGSYAVGPQGKERGYAKQDRLWFWGAGSAIRREAWLKLKEKGFKALINFSRDGVSSKKTSTGGEDGELCYAIQLAGYRPWYEPDLAYKHFIPAKRLTFDFYKKNQQTLVASLPIILIYYANVVALDRFKGKLIRIMYRNWYLHVFAIFGQFCKGLLLTLFRRKGFEYHQCIMQVQMLKRKFEAINKIGPRNFRNIVQRIDNLKMIGK